MVKRILSILIIILGATSLVASYQHHQSNAEQKSSVTMSVSRRQLKSEIYYKVDSQPDNVEESTLNKSISVTPTPIIVGEKELVTIFPSDFDKIDEKQNMKQTKQNYTYEVTDKEKSILEKLVEAEVEGQSLEAKENVCSNIIARVESDDFPDTIKKVVFQKNQYSSINNGRYYDLEVTDTTKEAVEYVLKNGITHNCLFYFNLKDIDSQKIKNWINDNLVFEFKDDAGHSYYDARE